MQFKGVIKIMTNLKFFGGVGTIGGNCIVIEDDDSRLMLDNGMCFSKEGEYYKDFLAARMGNDLRDFFALNLVPKIEGIYGKEKLIDECINDVEPNAQYIFKTDLESYGAYVERQGKPYIDAILLSHLHLDHIRNLIFMSPEIPVICSHITKKFLEIISDLTTQDYLNYDFPVRTELKSGYFPGAVKKNKKHRVREFIVAEPYKEIEIGKFKIIGYPVDHSVPGAMAFKIKLSDEKNIVYTGDIRFHGHEFERKNSEEFVKEVCSDSVDVLISEGTRILSDDGLSEEGVYNKVLNTLKTDSALSEKMIFTSFPWKSVSRFLTVLKIAKELGRILVVHPKLAYVLHHFKDFDSLGIKNVLKDENLKIYQPRKGSMLYSDGDYVYAKQCVSFENKWVKGEDITPLLYSTEYSADIHVRSYDIHENPNKYLLHLEFYSLSQLIDIKPPENSYYFNLKTEPFDEEGKIEKKVLENWMRRYNLDFRAGIHASGHASGREILEMIQKINPKRVFPIHTAHPELFKTHNPENNIILGKEYKI